MANVHSKPETISKLRFVVDAGFAMLAGMQLDLFTPLKAGPMTAEQLAAALGVGPARLRLLLYVLVAAELLTEQDGRFANTDEANQYLVKGEPSYMGNRHALAAEFRNRRIHPQRSAKRKAGFLQGFTRSTGNLPAQHKRERSSIGACFSKNRRLLIDQNTAGCGLRRWRMSITITRLCPHITATAVDLASVTSIAEKIVSEEGAAERVKVVAADAVKGPLTGTYDAAVLKSVLQVLSAQDARRAIHNVYDVLNPGGKLFIIGQILDDSRLSPLDVVGFNLAFINFFDFGESYTDGEHRD
jgi:hypothetical protein